MRKRLVDVREDADIEEKKSSNYLDARLSTPPSFSNVYPEPKDADKKKTAYKFIHIIVNPGPD